MKKRRIFLGFIALGLVAGIGIFHACKKEAEKTDVTSTKIQKQMYGDARVCITFEQHGVRKGRDKGCSKGGNGCWLWYCEEPENPFDIFGLLKFDICAIVSSNDDNGNGGGGNGGNNIVLDFKYADNNVILLQEFVQNDRFVVAEDIVEEGDSYLLKIVGTTQTCTIPAGSYPVTVYDDGIKVSLPVYKSGGDVIVPPTIVPPATVE